MQNQSKNVMFMGMNSVSFLEMITENAQIMQLLTLHLMKVYQFSKKSIVFKIFKSIYLYLFCLLIEESEIGPSDDLMQTPKSFKSPLKAPAIKRKRKADDRDDRMVQSLNETNGQIIELLNKIG